MDSIIKLQDITFTYDTEAPRPALAEVSLEVKKGEWVAIIGHNGSGKSTLAKTINGLLLPQSGSVQVGNLDLNEDNIWEIRKMVGMVFQNPDNQFVGSTVEDDVAFGMENQGIPREEMIERVSDALE
ncbi:ATP-binding cassette domain-containing protein, partial [Enterococcus sp. 2201sp1_2201st1_C11_2201SCRN_220225]